MSLRPRTCHGVGSSGGGAASSGGSSSSGSVGNGSSAYAAPEWWREAKLGAWAHWDPQSMPEKGDWYARKMYQEGDPVYAFHVRTFGHPSEYGYKDVSRNWVIDRWKPDDLMDLYVEMGAHFFMAMGVHHDNFDCWDSAYQPWNSVRVGPKVDVVGTADVAREAT